MADKPTENKMIASADRSFPIISVHKQTLPIDETGVPHTFATTHGASLLSKNRDLRVGGDWRAIETVEETVDKKDEVFERCAVNGVTQTTDDQKQRERKTSKGSTSHSTLPVEKTKGLAG